MEHLEAKKTEYTELFYDLVYVYAIGRVTSILYHLHDGIIPIFNLYEFFVTLFILLNSWVVQMAFTNRFGKNSLYNIIMAFIQMVFLIISQRAVQDDINQQSFFYLYFSFAMISMLFFVQYLIEYFRAENLEKRKMISSFISILSVRTAGIFIAAFLPYKMGISLAFTTTAVTWLAPLLLKHSSVNARAGGIEEVNMPHWTERLSLLVIIVFGEMIVKITDYFSVTNISIQSFMTFGIVASLFLIYIVEVDHMISHDHDFGVGYSFVYIHYPIIYGLSFITGSLVLIKNDQVNHGLLLAMVFSGITLFIIGILLHQMYNKEEFRCQKTVGLRWAVTIGISLALCLVIGDNRFWIIAILFATTAAIAGELIYYFFRNREL